jgi:dolichol-phosphate mannosyltransferase
VSLPPPLNERLWLRPTTAFWLVAAASAWLCFTLPVVSQEAYYWSYAHHPDLSYFDHPPMVAWLIWLGTTIFGDGVGVRFGTGLCGLCITWLGARLLRDFGFGHAGQSRWIVLSVLIWLATAIFGDGGGGGVRFGTWLCGLGITWFGARLVREFGVGPAGQSLWIVLSFASPILAMTHFLANPDAPLVCGWTIAMFALWKARDGALGWWLLAGVAAGFALLGKYSAAFLGFSGVLILLLDPQMRRQLLRPAPWLAVLVAALVFSPVVIWNVRNDFESFRFQTEDRFHSGVFGVHWLLQFVFMQVLVVHPLLAVAIGGTVAWLARRARLDVRARWLLALGLPLPLYMFVNSLWIQVKINWLAPAIVPLLLGTVLWWTEHLAARASRTLVRTSVVLLALVPVVTSLAPLFTFVPSWSGSSWTGWDQIAARAEAWEETVDRQDGVEGNCFFFAADYRDASQLQRNLLIVRRKNLHENPAEGNLDFEPTMAQNVFGMRALQYDHWSQPRDRVGQDAIFVLPRPEQRDGMVLEAGRHFTSIEKVEHVEVRRLWIVLEADIYVCRGYKGPD